MYLECFDDVKAITKRLVEIPSIVKTEGERFCAQEIYDYYKGIKYFKDNPDNLILQQTENDEIERYNVISMVKGTGGSSNRTIILMGHLDTVGVDDFEPLVEEAFNPDKLPGILRALNFSDEVNRDIESGDYMFGRGALDMKSGVAGQMYLMKYFSEHPEELDGNIIAIAECDEEDNSHGIISALTELKRLKEEDDLEYIAAINADYSTPYHNNDENRYIYLGTIGKLLPSFYVVGKEAHVGQAFGALDPNQIVAELTRLINLNPELSDESQGEVTIPPISLKQSDFKELYTVQTAIKACAYYNFFVYKMSPADVMEKMKEKAIEAFDNVVENLNSSYKRYAEMSNHEYEKLPWETRVYTWDEFYNELATLHGDKFTVYIHNFAKDLNENNPEMDLREFNMQIVDEAWKWSIDKSPAIIVFYGSNFYGRIELSGKDEGERLLIKSVEESIEMVQEYSDKPIVTKMFYPYISDMSYMGTSDSRESLLLLEKNTPAWGTKYHHPTDEILEINVPVVNIGTYGKDGHQVTERVHMKYTFENIPNITYNTIIKLLN